jgi:hypothetical protein
MLQLLVHLNSALIPTCHVYNVVQCDCLQTHVMRLQHPDDELGGSLLLVLPQVCACMIENTIHYSIGTSLLECDSPRCCYSVALLIVVTVAVVRQLQLLQRCTQ